MALLAVIRQLALSFPVGLQVSVLESYVQVTCAELVCSTRLKLSFYFSVEARHDSDTAINGLVV